MLLGSDRPPGMAGPTAIPFAAVDRYATRFDIEGEDFDEFYRFIRHCDAVYLKWAEEQRKARDAKR